MTEKPTLSEIRRRLATYREGKKAYVDAESDHTFWDEYLMPTDMGDTGVKYYDQDVAFLLSYVARLERRLKDAGS